MMHEPVSQIQNDCRRLEIAPQLGSFRSHGSKGEKWTGNTTFVFNKRVDVVLRNMV